MHPAKEQTPLDPIEAAAAEPVPLDALSAEEVTAWASLYEAERQDLSSLMGHALSLVGLVIAYSAAISGIISKDESKIFEGWFFLAIAAFPTWMAMGFHLNLMALVLAHGKSATHAESKLLGATDMAQSHRKYFGAMRGAEVTDLMSQSRSAQIQTLVAYGGVLALIVVFTGFCLWNVADKKGYESAITIGCIVFYTGLLVALLWAWIRLLKDDKLNPLGHSAEQPGSRD
jgi:hypothetical protein